MKSEIKQLWVEALRSDEYVQGVGALHSDTGRFCCLGVLCDLAVKAGVPVKIGTKIICGERVLTYDDDYAGLPVSVQDWAGIDGRYGKFSTLPFSPSLGVYPSGYKYLDSINDGGATFDQIATIIEEKF